MLYDTIEIRPSALGDWLVSHRELPYDREEGEGMLNGQLGFFHYPRKTNVTKAFEILRNKMIEEHLKIIAELQSQIDELRALEAPEYQGTINQSINKEF